MSTRHKLTILVLAASLLMLTLHLIVNGLPDLSSFNPHNR